MASVLPTMPTDAPVVKTEGENVSLTWQPGQPDPLTYSIEQKVDTDWQTVQEGVDGTDVTIVDANVQNDSEFRVKALNKYGESSPTEGAPVAKRADVPVLPSDRPTYELIDERQVELQWQPAQTADGMIDCPITYAVEKW